MFGILSQLSYYSTKDVIEGIYKDIKLKKGFLNHGYIHNTVTFVNILNFNTTF